jgi:hypothetical protein
MKPMKLSLLHVAACTALLAACSSSSVSATDGGDDGGTDAADASFSDTVAPADAPADTIGDAPAVCNTLVDVAPVVTVTQVASDPPAPLGGTIADGTYAMTDVTIYTGPQGPTGPTGSAQTTIQVSGSTVQVVSSGAPPTRTVTLAISGSAFTSTDSCPDTKVSQGHYTATATSLVILLPGGTDDAGARTVVETFTKQ